MLTELLISLILEKVTKHFNVFKLIIFKSQASPYLQLH